MERESSNKIEELVKNAVKELNGFIDVNSVIGTPLKTETGVIIPVTKITTALIAGGGEYGEVKLFKKDENYPFSGGSGSVISIKPMGFLVNNGKGFRLISVENDAYDKIFNACETFINSIRGDD
ncbi:MAG: sporulation protein YtfJ [Clostridia bacterium]|nr:sporulation protein YtfJ [Clostridia bacterium]